MAEKSGGENDPLRQTRWPWWGQFLLAVIALSVACVLLIWLPVEIGSKTASTSFPPMIVVFVGLTTMTISGMFLFMTFRIDRGARLEARNAAKEEMNKNEEIKNIIEETKELKECADQHTDSVKEKLREAENEFNKGRKKIESSVKEVERARGEAFNQIESAKIEAKTGVEGIATDVTDMLKRSVEDVGGRVREAEIASDVHRVADGVIGIADKVDDIADSVDRIGRHDGLASPRPRLLENWIGAVTFAHASVNFDGCEEVAESLKRKIKNTKKMVEKQCVLVIGYANTLGNEPYNDDLSGKRAKGVTECLADEVDSEIKFVGISTGERENKNNLHYPDSWYRAVDVYHYSSAGSCLSQAVGR